MTDLFWPGDHRAGEIFSARAFLTAMLDVEQAWLDVLVEAGVAPPAASVALHALVGDGDINSIAVTADRDGTPVAALVEMLRARATGAPARWVHRGLTSQDVVDSALMLCLHAAVTEIRAALGAQIRALIELTERHRHAAALARTLTQPALPTTVGMKAARWLSAVLDAAQTLAGVGPLPMQSAGAIGTLAATTELTGTAHDALRLAAAHAAALGLAPTTPWQTTRAIVTRCGDALVTCCDAWGHIAADTATGSRAEIGEFIEGRAGRSSTMPHKSNPTLSVLIRRAALVAPPLGATLHAASALSVDERSDGAWQAEWATLRTLTRHTVSAAAHTTELIESLQVRVERCAANLAAADGLDGEQQTMAHLTGRAALPTYLGATHEVIDAQLRRARTYLETTP